MAGGKSKRQLKSREGQSLKAKSGGGCSKGVALDLLSDELRVELERWVLGVWIMCGSPVSPPPLLLPAWLLWEFCQPSPPTDTNN